MYKLNKKIVQFVRMCKSKYILTVVVLFIVLSVKAQESDSLLKVYALNGVEVHDLLYEARYKQMLEKVRKIYPYALYAQKLLEQYNADVKNLTKNAQIKKYGRTALDELKEKFKYTLRNMYTSEGELLMKLIYRETGETVYDIIKKFRGGSSAGFYYFMGLFFDQNLKIEYHPKQDWLIERVIKDIQSGKYTLYEMDLLDKLEYKSIRKSEKKKQKDLKKAYRLRKTQNKEARHKK
jgi:hypothetical protein